MKLLSRGFVLAAACAAIAISACSDEVPDDDATSSETALERVKLTKQEIVGVIKYGRQLEVQHSGLPVYRALAFDGAAGDRVEIDVSTPHDNNPEAWLLSAAFKTLAFNDNAAKPTLNARIVHTLPTSGRFYIALKERHGRSTDFTVRLANQKPTVFDAWVGRRFELKGSCDTRVVSRRYEPVTQYCAETTVAGMTGSGPCVSTLTVLKEKSAFVARISALQNTLAAACFSGAANVGDSIDVPLTVAEVDEHGASGVFTGKDELGADKRYFVSLHNADDGGYVSITGEGHQPSYAFRASQYGTCVLTTTDSRCSLSGTTY